MPDVVHQDGQPRTQHLLISQFDALHLQNIKSPVHQIQRPQHVAEPRVHGAGIDQTGEPQLLDAPLPLKERVRQHIEDNVVLYSQKPVIHRVVDYLAFVGHHTIFLIV